MQRTVFVATYAKFARTVFVAKFARTQEHKNSVRATLGASMLSVFFLCVAERPKGGVQVSLVDILVSAAQWAARVVPSE